MPVAVKAGAGAAAGGPGAKGTAGAKKRAGGGKGGKSKKKKKSKKDCKKKLSDAQKKKLRDATPSTAIDNMVNNKPKPMSCPACHQSAPPGFTAATGRVFQRLSADHIVPVDAIMKKKGFACLSEANQKKVLNNPKNFVGMCPPCNFARGATKWKDWNGRPPGLGAAGKTFAQTQAAAAQRISSNLGAQIGRLL